MFYTKLVVNKIFYILAYYSNIFFYAKTVNVRVVRPFYSLNSNYIGHVFNIPVE